MSGTRVYVAVSSSAFPERDKHIIKPDSIAAAVTRNRGVSHVYHKRNDNELLNNIKGVNSNVAD